MKRLIKMAVFGVSIAAVLSACETYDDSYHGTHRHTYYQESGTRPYAYGYGYENVPEYRYDRRGNYSGDWPYRTYSDTSYRERAYVRPGGVRVYRY